VGRPERVSLRAADEARAVIRGRVTRITHTGVALTPNPLSGAHRVGIFVLVRNDGNEDGRDEFVNCMGD
jgi:hypothetical protein